MVAQNTKAGFLAFAGMIALMSPCSAALTTPPATENKEKCDEIAKAWREGAANSYTGRIINYLTGGSS